MTPGKGLIRVTRICAILAVLGYGGWYAYNRMLQPEEIRRRAQEEIAAKFEGVDVEIGSARMRPFLGGIDITDLKLIRRDDPTRTPFVHIAKAIIWHDRADLARRLTPSRIEIDSAKLRLVREANGTWNVQDVVRISDTNESSPAYVIKSATVETIDRQSGRSATVEYNDVDFTVVNDPASVWVLDARGTAKPFGPFHVKARYERGVGAQGTLDLGGLPINTELRHLISLVEPDAAEHLSAINGTFTTRSRWSWKPARTPPVVIESDFELSNATLNVPGFPFLLEQVALKGKFEGNGLKIETFSAKVGSCDVQAKLEVSPPTMEEGCDPLVELCTSIEDRVQRLELSLTDLIVGQELFDKVLPKLSPKYADVRDMFLPVGPCDVTFEVRADRAGQHYSCTVKPKGMSAKYRGFPYPMDQIRGSIETTVAPGGPPVVRIDLVGEGKGKPVTLKGQITAGENREVELSITGNDVVLDKTLIEALPDDYPRIVGGLRPTAQGDFTAKIRHNERIRRDHGPEIFDNEFDIRLRTGSLNYDEFPYPLRNLNGRIVIRTAPDVPTGISTGPGLPVRAAPGEIGSLDFQDMTANGPGGSKLRIKGGRWPEVGGSLLALDITGENVPLDGELYRAISRLKLHNSWQSFDPTGRMNCEISVRLHDRNGPDGRPLPLEPARDLELGIAFNGPSILPKFFPYQLTEIAGQVAYARRRVEIKQFRASHGAVSITLPFAEVRLPASGGLWASLTDLRVSPVAFDREFLQAMPRGLRSAALGLDPKGAIGIHAKQLIIDGQPKRHSNGAEVPQVVAAAYAPSARAVAPTVDRDELPTIYWNGTLTFRDAQLNTGVTWDGVTGQLSSTGRYEGDRLGRVIASLNIDKGRVMKQPFQQLTARFEVDPARPDVIEVPWINSKFYGGEIGGDARLVLGTPVRFDLRLDGSKLRLEEFARINQMGPKTQIEGIANAHLTLTNAPEPGTRTPLLQGSGSIDVPNGKMLDLPIMLDVLKLARLRPMDRTMFEEAHAVFRIRGNRMKFGQLDLLGNAVSLGGEGEMDLDGKNAHFDLYTVWTNIRNLLGGTGELPARLSSNLYRIHVAGDLGSDRPPRVTQEPLPVVLEPVRRLLGRVAK